MGVECLHILDAGFGPKADEISVSFAPIAWTTGEYEIVQIVRPAILPGMEVVSRAILGE